jgi:beta-ribofuranosylaminobenzene 5'-phosphate synthase
VAVPAVESGLNGEGEEGVFSTLIASKRISEEVCWLTQLRLMPALVDGDIEEFGAALAAIDRKTAAYFSGVQGGTYSSGRVGEIVDAMMRAGACGAGQSSWGPAIYGLVHESDAARVEEEVRSLMASRGSEGHVFVGRGRNCGAHVEIES